MEQQTCLFLYRDTNVASLDLQIVADYVKNILPPIEVIVRDSFFRFHLGESTEEDITHLAKGFARAKVRNPMLQDDDFPPLLGETDFERRRLEDPEKGTWGLLYDGFKVMILLQELIPKAERNLSHIHIVFTKQLLGTWDEDLRYHARVSVYGFPTILSTSGIVEAPAKPREFYFLRQQYASMGMADATAADLDGRFRGQYIDHDDKRLTDVMKGYVMQAIGHHFWGNPFCPDAYCRFYNAHWQKEVIGSQLEGDYEFCSVHQEKLLQLRNEV